MCRHTYDDDDYEFTGFIGMDVGGFFGDMDDEYGELDPIDEDVMLELNRQLIQIEGELATAIAQGNLHLVDRLQDEIELLHMVEH